MYPRAPEEVQVFSTAPPNRAYVEVGLLEAGQDSYNYASTEELIEKLRSYAGRKGCEGLIITGSADRVESQGKSPTGSTIVETKRGFKAACVMFVDESAAATASATQPNAPSCIPGESRACVGVGGCKGGQVCSADGKRFDACDCGTASPANSGTPPLAGVTP